MRAMLPTMYNVASICLHHLDRMAMTEPPKHGRAAGGRARKKNTTAKQRKDTAKKAAQARWELDELPMAVTSESKPIRLADFKGRPIILNIWAKWCAPCLVEMPELNRLQSEAAPGTLAVVAVAVDEPDPAKVRNFLANRRWDALKPYLDPKNVFAKALNIKSIPVSLLIDRDGFALVRVYAPVAWYSDEAIRLLKRTIGL